MKLGQVRVYSGLAITKKPYFIFLNSAWLILEWYFSGRSMGLGLIELLVQLRVLFSCPVGYFLLQAIPYSNNQTVMHICQLTSMMLQYLLACFLALLTRCQVEPFWWIPISGLQIGTVSLIVNGYPTESPRYTSITFSRSFSSIPAMGLSLSSLKNSQSTIGLYQESPTRTLTSFTHKLTLWNPSRSIQTLKICYCAVDLGKFTYLYPQASTIPLNSLSQSYNPTTNTEHVLVAYLSPLSPSNYQLVALLTGFHVISNSSYSLAIQGRLYTDSQFMLKVQAQGGKVMAVQVLRVLVDKTMESAQTVVLHLLQVLAGSVQHFEDSTSVYYPARDIFYSDATFYGIMQFRNYFQCQYNLSIHAPSVPAQAITIGFVVFKQFICSTGKVFEQSTSTCYPKTSPRIYQINIEYYGFCNMACYLCTGPAFSDCTEMLPTEAVNTTHSIECKPEYATSTRTGHCIPCSSFVNGCDRCTAGGDCTRCLQYCTLVNSTFCDCSGLCSSLLQFISPHSGTCECLPQHYRMGNGSCGPCIEGCYTCRDTAVNCESCIDGYELEGSSCLNFVRSNYILDSTLGSGSSRDRCIQYSDSICLRRCSDESYMYSRACYLYECPVSFFPYLEIYSNSRMCQPCPPTCYDCDNFFVCKKCIPGSYYLNASGYCVGCMDGCTSCTSTLCTNCSLGYTLNASGKCDELLPVAAASCALGCARCLVYDYCQVCSPGYFRNQSSNQCTACSGTGLLSVTQMLEGVSRTACQQICGDGLLFMDQCDDGNTEAGDGCDALCAIQQDFSCLHVASLDRSVCLPANLPIQCGFSKNLTNNQLNITLSWSQGGIIKFAPSCPEDVRIVSEDLQPSSSTYTVAYSESSVEGKACSFAVPSSTTPTIVCNISASPLAEATGSSSPVVQYLELVMQYIGKPLAYWSWAVCILGIDPFDILINHSFLYLHLATMYDFPHEPPSSYSIFAHLNYFAFHQVTPGKERASMAGIGFLDPCKWTLVLLAAVVGFHEIVVRFLKNDKLFCACQVRLFTHIFNSRLVLYAVVYTSMLPSTLLFTLSLLSAPQLEAMAVVIACLHLLCLVATNILVICLWHRLRAKSHVKYLYFIIVFQQLGMLVCFDILSTSGALLISAWSLIVALLLWLAYALGDCSHQFADTEEQGVYEEHYFRSYGANLQQLQLPAQQARKTANRVYKLSTVKQMVRKTNIVVQVAGFVTVSLLRCLYFQSGFAKEAMGPTIVIIFVCANLLMGFCLNLISQIVTLVHHASAELLAETATSSDSASQGQLGDGPSLSQFSRDN